MLRDGIVYLGDEDSGRVSGLFYGPCDGRYLIDTGFLEGRLGLDVFLLEGHAVVRNAHHQFDAYYGYPVYLVDGSEAASGSPYAEPYVSGGRTYIDASSLFDLFGYDLRSDLSHDKSLLSAYLQKREGNAGIYDEITMLKPAAMSETVTSQPEIYDPGDLPEPSLVQPAEVLPTVSPADDTDYVPPAETDDIEVVDEVPDVDVHPGLTAEPDKRVMRTVNMPDHKTEEEFLTLWSEKKGTLVNIFSEGAPSLGNAAYAIRSDNMVVFNPSHGGRYVDSISVNAMPIDGGYIEARFIDDWSDLSGGTFVAESKAYYEGYPAVVHRTLIALLGQTEGDLLFEYIRMHADKSPQGGNVYGLNENGALVSYWSDEAVTGDGMLSSELDFEDWQNRVTGDGLRYSVSRLSDGICVMIFKN